MTRLPGPTAATVARVRVRDADACARCGMPTLGGSIHHRQGRGGRDPHRDANLVLLCGSGTTGCHGWTHAHPAAAYGAGLMVRRHAITACEDVPMRTWRGWMTLGADGAFTPTQTPGVEPGAVPHDGAHTATRDHQEESA